MVPVFRPIEEHETIPVVLCKCGQRFVGPDAPEQMRRHQLGALDGDHSQVAESTVPHPGILAIATNHGYMAVEYVTDEQFNDYQQAQMEAYQRMQQQQQEPLNGHAEG